MKNKEFEIVNKFGGKPVNIYLNDETLILEELFEKKYNQKPNRSKIYKEYLKKQLDEELIKKVKEFDKSTCDCCKRDYSFTKKQMYLCNEKLNKETCIVCHDCITKE
ncbi:hypothetical protein [Mesoplasma coleopterae]|uniref:Uncharacterized protein n=1 Tax=Mesoplasma coleopterae TaxID=324078 RepID=A0A2K8P1L5_9MOLU|nr:hypothetical protein [Mesoplasma coleopterae]ATZ20576.1 hypothetical protein MCOLE_v1c00610 [Mesoplasma coleopterae]AVN62097.1 hypothetical protein CG001_00270 [Mesoplasma coleopterae]AVN62762.1 hypothetical protein CG000_00320 [Mesoplasma coleopterae]